MCILNQIELNQQNFNSPSKPSYTILSKFCANRHQEKWCVSSIESSWINNIFNPPSKPSCTVFCMSGRNRLPVWQILIKREDSCWFNQIENILNRPSKAQVRSSFQVPCKSSSGMTNWHRDNLIKSSWLDNIFNPPSKSELCLQSTKQQQRHMRNFLSVQSYLRFTTDAYRTLQY